MEYTKGTIGRVFLLKFKDGDILIDELNRFAKKEKIRAATLVFIGALKKGDLVMIEAMGGGFTWGAALIRW